MDETLKRQWYRFITGKWTVDLPQQVGVYPLARLDGAVCDEEVTVYWDEKTGTYKASKVWGGFYWSRPRPPMPVPTKRQIQAYGNAR